MDIQSLMIFNFILQIPDSFRKILEVPNKLLILKLLLLQMFFHYQNPFIIPLLLDPWLWKLILKLNNDLLIPIGILGHHHSLCLINIPNFKLKHLYLFLRFLKFHLNLMTFFLLVLTFLLHIFVDTFQILYMDVLWGYLSLKLLWGELKILFWWLFFHWLFKRTFFAYNFVFRGEDIFNALLNCVFGF